MGAQPNYVHILKVVGDVDAAMALDDLSSLNRSKDGLYFAVGTPLPLSNYPNIVGFDIPVNERPTWLPNGGADLSVQAGKDILRSADYSLQPDEVGV